MDSKIVYTITIRTNSEGFRAGAVVKNEQNDDGSMTSKLTMAFAQEDLELLMAILDGKKRLSNAIGGEIHAD